MLMRAPGKNGGDILEINDIPHKDGIVFLEDGMVCVRISSKDNTSCDKIHNIVRTLFDDAKVIYKFIGYFNSFA